MGPIRREQRKHFHMNGKCSQLGLLALLSPLLLPPVLEGKWGEEEISSMAFHYAFHANQGLDLTFGCQGIC